MAGSAPNVMTKYCGGSSGVSRVISIRMPSSRIGPGSRSLSRLPVRHHDGGEAQHDGWSLMVIKRLCRAAHTCAFVERRFALPDALRFSRVCVEDVDKRFVTLRRGSRALHTSADACLCQCVPRTDGNAGCAAATRPPACQQCHNACLPAVRACMSSRLRPDSASSASCASTYVPCGVRRFAGLPGSVYASS